MYFFDEQILYHLNIIKSVAHEKWHVMFLHTISFHVTLPSVNGVDFVIISLRVAFSLREYFENPLCNRLKGIV